MLSFREIVRKRNELAIIKPTATSAMEHIEHYLDVLCFYPTPLQLYDYIYTLADINGFKLIKPKKIWDQKELLPSIHLDDRDKFLRARLNELKINVTKKLLNRFLSEVYTITMNSTSGELNEISLHSLFITLMPTGCAKLDSDGMAEFNKWCNAHQKIDEAYTPGEYTFV